MFDYVELYSSTNSYFDVYLELNSILNVSTKDTGPTIVLFYVGLDKALRPATFLLSVNLAWLIRFTFSLYCWTIYYRTDYYAALVGSINLELSLRDKAARLFVFLLTVTGVGAMKICSL